MEKSMPRHPYLGAQMVGHDRVVEVSGRLAKPVFAGAYTPESVPEAPSYNISLIFINKLATIFFILFLLQFNFII